MLNVKKCTKIFYHFLKIKKQHAATGENVLSGKTGKTFAGNILKT
jgi:hypothetical protein